MSKLFSRFALSTLFAFSLVGFAQASPILVTDVSIESAAIIGNSLGFDINSQQTQTSSDAVLSGALGGITSETEVTWLSSGNMQSLALNFDHVVADGFDKKAITNGWVKFTALQDATYNLAGFYSSAFQAQNINMNVGLGEVVPGLFGGFTTTNIFAHSEFYAQGDLFLGSTSSTINLGLGTLTTDVSGFGSSSNQVVGDLSGNLVAGKDYVLGFNFNIENPPACATINCVDFFSNPPSASANGSLSLAITTASVPETPASLLLLSGVLGLIRRGRKTAVRKGK